MHCTSPIDTATLSTSSIIRIFCTYGTAALLISLCTFIYYHRVATWIVLLITDLWLIANLLYFRSYHDLLNIWCLDSANQLGLYEGIITPYLQLSDIIPFLFTLSWIVFTCIHPTPKKRWISPALLVGSGCSLLLLFAPWCLSAHRSSTPINPLNAYYHDVSMGRVWYASTFSFITHGINELKSLPLRWQHTEEPSTLDIEPDRYFTYEASPTESKYNVVIVLFESLESWVLDTTLLGEEITPNLNRLLHHEHTLFIKEVQPQVKMGRSADAQLTILTGLLPIDKGVTCMRYANNTYPSLAAASMADYKKMYVPTSPSAWNQNAMTPALGFDALYAQEVSDHAITQQLLSDISQQSSFFVTMTTMASHIPYTAYADSSTLNLQQDHPYANYLRSINYTDACLANLITYCTNQSDKPLLLVITGDHTTLDSPLSHTVPLLLYTTDGLSGQLPTEALQMDIYPTLLHLMGCTYYYWGGLGINLFDESAQRVQQANTISNTLIQTNYFYNANKHYQYNTQSNTPNN